MKKFISIFLIISLLASQVYVSVSRHICGGKVRSVSLTLLNHSENCGMSDVSDKTSCSNNNSVEKKCCEDSFQTFVVENNYLPQQQKASFSVLQIFALLNVLLVLVFSSILLKIKSFVYHSPPKVIPTQKVLALKQVYRL
jgi:hypothetical protein